MKPFPFRLGTTSYIIPADILPNVRYLAGKVRDIELVLFEVDEEGPDSPAASNLPDASLCAELRRLAALYDLSWTVHLPLDLRLAEDGSARDKSIEKARRVIESIRSLDPWAYIVHLDGRQVRGCTDPARLQSWQDNAVKALEIVGGWAGGVEKLAVENLEGYPADFWDPVLERIPVSRCVDVGHLWLDGVPVLPYLQRAMPRTRVIHMHGIAARDHASLAHIAQDELDEVLTYLRAEYTGVATMEIFQEQDFLSSLEALRAASNRIQRAKAPLTLILGGARSGKSRWAQTLARRMGGRVLYVATAQAGDEEMRRRIMAHRAERPASWRTLEAPLRLGEAIEQELAREPADVVLVDCITMLVSNVLLSLPEDAPEEAVYKAMLAEIESLLASRARGNACWILVSNEVGLGLVPPYKLGRLYRDGLGRVNQRLARAADETFLLVAGKGIPLCALDGDREQ